MNKIGDNNLINYFNLSTLLGEIINFVKNIFSARSLNNNIITNINSLVVRI